jgi:DNA-binding response OmpR family regulator
VRVLIVDDYIDYAIPLRDMFRYEGHETMYCLSSTGIVDLALEFKPDWVVLDIKMPHISGVSVYKELNEKADFEFSVVFYTNYCTDPEVLEEFKKLGVPDTFIIPKTVDFESDVLDKLIPALQEKKLVRGKKNDR